MGNIINAASAHLFPHQSFRNSRLPGNNVESDAGIEKISLSRNSETTNGDREVQKDRVIIGKALNRAVQPSSGARDRDNWQNKVDFISSSSR